MTDSLLLRFNHNGKIADINNKYYRFLKFNPFIIQKVAPDYFRDTS